MTKIEIEKEISNILGLLQDASDLITELKSNVTRAYEKLENLDLEDEDD